ncbi:MAG: hypothetical protein JWO52_2636 [Gammaproteobacteria bacterium]|nr:hypothetical protein [Gammaproteobacteria bacterium]
MPTIVKPICIAALVLTLSACSKLGMGQDEMAWARGALDRNDRLQVVAADTGAKTFTVRMKDSGQLVVIPIDKVVAGPSGGAEVPTKQAASAPPPPEAPADAPAPPPQAPESVSSPAGTTAPSPSQGTGGSTVASTGEPAGAAGRQAAREESYGQSGSADQAMPPMDEKGPHAESAANARAGRVLASGPGYSIKASGSKAGPARPSPATVAQGKPERLHDPIICQGSRLLHIDNRNLEFDGDAITAEDGCEIHITNTHISAKGIGVLARAANVHIKNSEIDGASGAVDATDGAQVYAESSRFKGLTRRLESSAFHDLGGNVWN